ncbi:MAG: hypothetical protein M1838_003116 [Thelocarpon superellum]|nr:MAG: hypothetical protein M1838_003116 [Thelocarpon superellum]
MAGVKQGTRKVTTAKRGARQTNKAAPDSPAAPTSSQSSPKPKRPREAGKRKAEVRYSSEDSGSGPVLLRRSARIRDKRWDTAAKVEADDEVKEWGDDKRPAITTASRTVTMPTIPVSSGPVEPLPSQLTRLGGPAVRVVPRTDSAERFPPATFRVIAECVLGQGVERVSAEVMEGCTCKVENGRSVGCEYLLCSCLSQAAKKRFPYTATGPNKGTLRTCHLRTRDAIFECNPLCNCRDNCKNKLVQWGRQVPLEIFHTGNRGWGLRCPVDLRQGDFVDTYRGEIITEEECHQRDQTRQVRDVYTFSLDKFQDDNENNEWAMTHKYVIDGEYVGGPTRYINHSCNPNLKQFTVSYNHSDPCIYDLAFFTKRFVPAFTELTFDYMGRDDEEVDDEDEGHEGDEGRIRCLCGEPNCRKFLWG